MEHLGGAGPQQGLAGLGTSGFAANAAKRVQLLQRLQALEHCVAASSCSRHVATMGDCGMPLNACSAFWDSPKIFWVTCKPSSTRGRVLAMRSAGASAEPPPSASGGPIGKDSAKSAKSPLASCKLSSRQGAGRDAGTKANAMKAKAKATSKASFKISGRHGTSKDARTKANARQKQ